jgi:hypothetical protein
VGEKGMGLIKNNRGEFGQSTLSACMEISQSKPFVKLTYANKNRKEKS